MFYVGVKEVKNRLRNQREEERERQRKIIKVADLNKIELPANCRDQLTPVC